MGAGAGTVSAPIPVHHMYMRALRKVGATLLQHGHRTFREIR